MFSSSSGLKELANIVDRISHIGACELLVGHEVVSLRSLDIKETSVAGALVERQVECLNDNRRKEGVREIIVGLMRDAIGVYEEGDMPIRRARVLLGALEFAYYVGPEHIAAIGSIEDIGKVIEELLSREVSNSRAASHSTQFLMFSFCDVDLWTRLWTESILQPISCCIPPVASITCPPASRCESSCPRNPPC